MKRRKEDAGVALSLAILLVIKNTDTQTQKSEAALLLPPVCHLPPFPHHRVSFLPDYQSCCFAKK